MTTGPPTPGRSGRGVRWARARRRSCAAVAVVAAADATAVAAVVAVGDTAGRPGCCGEGLLRLWTWLFNEISANNSPSDQNRQWPWLRKPHNRERCVKGGLG